MVTSITVYGQGANVAVGIGVGGCSVAYEPGLCSPGYAVAVKDARRPASAVSAPCRLVVLVSVARRPAWAVSAGMGGHGAGATGVAARSVASLRAMMVVVGVGGVPVAARTTGGVAER